MTFTLTRRHTTGPVTLTCNHCGTTLTAPEPEARRMARRHSPLRCQTVARRRKETS